MVALHLPTANAPGARWRIASARERALTPASCWLQRILLDRELEYLKRAKHRPTAVMQVRLSSLFCPLVACAYKMIHVCCIPACVTVEGNFQLPTTLASCQRLAHSVSVLGTLATPLLHWHRSRHDFALQAISEVAIALASADINFAAIRIRTRLAHYLNFRTFFIFLWRRPSLMQRWRWQRQTSSFTPSASASAHMQIMSPLRSAS